MEGKKDYLFYVLALTTFYCTSSACRKKFRIITVFLLLKQFCFYKARFCLLGFRSWNEIVIWPPSWTLKTVLETCSSKDVHTTEQQCFTLDHHILFVLLKLILLISILKLFTHTWICPHTDLTLILVPPLIFLTHLLQVLLGLRMTKPWENFLCYA